MQTFPYTVGRIRLAVGDLSAAIEQYTVFLGSPPIWVGKSIEAGVGLAVFCLANTAIELFEAETSSAYIEEIVLDHPDIPRGDWEPLPGLSVTTEPVVYDGEDGPLFDDIAHLPAAGTRGLPISLAAGRFVGALRSMIGEAQPAKDCVQGVDHVVVNSHDPEASIRLFGEGGLGIRLALDQTVEAWGGRMLFFRAGGLTIEVVSSEKMQALGTDAADFYWGIAYKVEDLNATSLALLARGVKLSEVRKGRKPGTVVATIKSHDLGIPTLLIASV